MRALSTAIAGNFGNKASISPRMYLKKLLDMLDRVEIYEDFDPRRDGAIVLANEDLTVEERAAIGRSDVDDIEIQLP